MREHIEASGPGGPLAGLKVVELGESTAAPYAAKLLGDFGADVVKIEAPSGGDPTRRRGPFPGGRPDPERSGLFLYLNTNKLGLTLDPSRGAARAVLERLLDWADVFVTNATLERLRACRLAPAALRASHPRLVVTTITPFGTDGPYAHWRGDELTTYAAGGLAYSTPGMPDAAEDLEREPPLHPACFVAETIAGVIAATSTMLAVFGGAEDGGCHVEVSQHAAVAAIQQRDIAAASYTGSPYTRLLDPQVIGRVPNFYLPCKDGYVALAAPADAHWQRLVEAMGGPEWAVGDRFSTGAARAANWQELRLRLIEWTMERTGDELYGLAEKLRLPFFPLYSLRRMAESDHVRERGSFVTFERDGVTIRMPGRPIHMHGSPWALRRPAPKLGEHTWEILHGWLGYDAVAIGQLRASGAA